MTQVGTVRDGVVWFTDGLPLPDGTQVRIEVIDASKSVDAKTPTSAIPGSTFAERFREFVGAFEGLPSDAAKNHDQYLTGKPLE